MKAKSVEEMIMDPKLGKSDSKDMFRIHKELTHLDQLHDFCAEHNFGYGMHEDKSVYVSEKRIDSDYWWGRLFENGVAEEYFFLDEYKHLRPILKSILENLRDVNPQHFKGD